MYLASSGSASSSSRIPTSTFSTGRSFHFSLVAAFAGLITARSAGMKAAARARDLCGRGFKASTWWLWTVLETAAFAVAELPLSLLVPDTMDESLRLVCLPFLLPPPDFLAFSSSDISDSLARCEKEFLASKTCSIDAPVWKIERLGEGTFNGIICAFIFWLCLSPFVRLFFSRGCAISRVCSSRGRGGGGGRLLTAPQACFSSSCHRAANSASP